MENLLHTVLVKKKKKLSIVFVILLTSRGAENVRTREQGSGEILINNLKTEKKWKFFAPLLKCSII